ncbi:MAG: ribosome maturation factor RimM [Terriglobia bacterium]
MTPIAWLTVARIVKTQGRHGEVAAEILTDFPQRLAQRRRVWLWDGANEPRPAEVQKIWPHKNYLVFHFARYHSIEQAEGLVGQEIQIPRREAAPLGETEFYLAELVGCRVVEQASGVELGRVREVLPTGGTDLLAVDTPEGQELLIPFVEEFCLRVAPEERLIEVVLPEGLRNLNK